MPQRTAASGSIRNDRCVSGQRSPSQGLEIWSDLSGPAHFLRSGDLWSADPIAPQVSDAALLLLDDQCGHVSRHLSCGNRVETHALEVGRRILWPVVAFLWLGGLLLGEVGMLAEGDALHDIVQMLLDLLD